MLPIKALTISFRLVAPAIRLVFSAVGLLTSALRALWDWIGKIGKRFAENTTVGRGLAKVFGAIGDAVSTVWDFVKGLWDTSGGFFSSVADWMDKLGLSLSEAEQKQSNFLANQEKYGAYEPGPTEPGMSYDTDLIYRMEQSREMSARVEIDFVNLPRGAQPKVKRQDGGKVDVGARGNVLEPVPL